MARLKQYDKGYLSGQLDAAENELEILYTILNQMPQEPHSGDMILVRIKDIEEFLTEHGRLDEDASEKEWSF
ncbi:hypothetical protein [Cytobacillus praedii]|uniref:Uncharacterized protein n=1 Tax=Cytobacillus praedii TaxID=1742358 RepID=A0A4R1ATP4_9BACI|nr:hypothetical protein [Cytobacillus praedii]TCJ00959.1 hypothetical protein E0Y62_26380 [Cytobacillus praedii]